MSKGGRRGKYHEWLEEDGLIKLEGWARLGLTDEQIANNIGIVPSTLYEWKKRYSEISDALKRGKEVIDFEVENALLKRALGHEIEEVKQYVEKDETGKDRKKVEKIKKEISPDTTAIIYWLKNRQPERWGNVATKLDIEEQEARIERIKADTQRLTGSGQDVEDLSEVYGEIYGDYDRSADRTDEDD